MSLKLKTTDFQVRTRAQTISSYTSSAEAIFAVAQGILRAEIQAESPKPLRLRLMGEKCQSQWLRMVTQRFPQSGFELKKKIMIQRYVVELIPDF